MLKHFTENIVYGNFDGCESGFSNRSSIDEGLAFIVVSNELEAPLDLNE